jgi:hypothetical protein
LVERRFPKPDVVGSSPTRREKSLFLLFSQKILQFGSVLDLSAVETIFSEIQRKE